MSKNTQTNSMLTKSKGFTLLEVLFAMAIATFGFLSLALMQGVSGKGNSVSNSVTQATFLAQQRIEEVKSRVFPAVNMGAFPIDTVLSDDPEIDLDELGNVIPGGGKYSRRTVIRSNTTFSRSVTVTVTWLATGYDSIQRNSTVELTSTTRGEGN